MNGSTTEGEVGPFDGREPSLPFEMARVRKGSRITLNMIFFLIGFALLLYAGMINLSILGFFVAFFLPPFLMLVAAAVGSYLFDRGRGIEFDGSALRLMLTDGRAREMRARGTLRVDVAMEHGRDVDSDKGPPKDWSTGAAGDFAFRRHGPLSGMIVDQDGDRFYITASNGYGLDDIRVLWDLLTPSLDHAKVKFSKDAVRYLRMRHRNGQDDGFTEEELNALRAHPPYYMEPITIGEIIFLTFGICVPSGFALIMIYWEKDFWTQWLMVSLPAVLGLLGAEWVWRYRKHIGAIERAKFGASH